MLEISLYISIQLANAVVPIAKGSIWIQERIYCRLLQVSMYLLA